MVLAFIALPIATIIFLVKPHILNKSKYITKPISRQKILLIGLVAFAVSLFSFTSIMAATEPESVKQQRATEASAKLKAQQDEEAVEKAAAEERLEEEAKKPVVKTETKTESVPFETIEEQDTNLPQGQIHVAVEGAKGERTITYEVTYVEGKETARKQTKSEITTAPITEITKVGTYVAPPPTPTPTPAPTPQANTNVYYRNCTAARAAGAAPVHRGEPGYASHLDRDNDGIGCE